MLSPILVADVLDPIIVGRYADMAELRGALDKAITELEEHSREHLLRLIRKQTGGTTALSHNARSLGGHFPIPSIASVTELPACGAMVEDDTPIESNPVNCPDCLHLLLQAGFLD